MKYSLSLLCLVGTFALHPAKAELPVLPQPATSFGAALSEGWLYIYGGNTGKAHEFHRECIKGDFFRLRLPDGDKWETLPTDQPLLGAPMAAHDGWVYRVGGMEARNEKGAKNDLHSTDVVRRYHPNTGKWETLPSLPETRSSHDIAIFGDKLYAGGGWKLTGGGDGEDSRGDWHKTLLWLDLKAPDKGWHTEPQPFQRRAIAMVVQGNRLWFLGGMDSKDEPSSEVDWYEPATNTWGKGPVLPDGNMAGFGMAACAAGDAVLASPLSGKVYSLSGDAKTWKEVTKLAKARFFHRLLPITNDQLVAVGGSSRKGQIPELELVSLKAGDAPKEAATSAETPATAPAKTPSEPKSAATWPEWRGLSRDGISNERGWRKSFDGGTPPQLWRTQVGLGMSSPVVANGRLITLGNDGKDNDFVIALDAANGTELWRYTYPCATTSHEMPIVPSGPGSTPTLAEGKVYTVSREGEVICLDAASGQLVWRRNMVKELGGKRPVYGYSQSPLIDNGRVILDVGSEKDATGSTVAVDAKTGELIWKAGSGEAGYSSARIFERDGRRLVAMFKGEALDVLDPANGKVLWSYRTTSRDFTNAATPALVGHRILVSNTGTDQAALLDWDLQPEANAHPSWQQKQFALLFNSAIPYKNSLFAFNEKRRGHDEFTCVDAASGESRWVSGAVPTSTFILADDHWVFLTRGGEIVIAEAGLDEPKITARFKAVEGKCYATPTLAGGRLYARSNDGEIAAFDIRAIN